MDNIGSIPVTYKRAERVRQTSIDCYHEIKNSGLLSKRRLQALEYIMKIAPCTASELQESMPYNDGGRDCMKRISELATRGVVYEKGVRECRVTGRHVIEWDMTGNLPKDVETPVTPKQKKVTAALDALRDLYENKNTNEKWVEVANLIKSI